MSDDVQNIGEGLSEQAYIRLKSAQQAIVDANAKLEMATSLVTDAASVDDAEKSTELVKIGVSLTEAQKDLFRANTEFVQAKLERELSLHAKIWQGFWRVVTSGFFFMAAGVLLIYLAQKGVVGEHSSITFIWVVLGAAILLFGTGTLGMAKLDGTLPSGTWSASVAGGAGALALIIAAGFVSQHTAIRQAFQTQKNYFRIHVFPDFSGGVPQKLEDMQATATSVNRPIPVVHESTFLEVFVPFPSGIKNGEVLEVAVSMTPKGSKEKYEDQIIKMEFNENGSFVSSVDGGAHVWRPKDSAFESAAAKVKNGAYYFVFPPDEDQDSSSIDRHENVDQSTSAPELPPVDTGGT